jgi:hypothetical protein
MNPLVLVLALLSGSSDSAAIPDTTQRPKIDSNLVERTGPETTGKTSFDSTFVDLSAIPNPPKSIDLKDRIGEYFLYWNTEYTLHLSNDGVSVIEPPKNFSIDAAVIGNGKLFAIQQAKNRVTIKKLAFDNVSTNLILVMSTPNGEAHSVSIEVKGGSTTTSIVRFVVPTTKEVNETVEKVKVLFVDQMNTKLKDQETVLNTSVWKGSLLDQYVFRIPEDLIVTEESWKGATFRLDAVVNSRDEAIIYVSTDATDRECQVVELFAINSRDGIVRKRAELIGQRKINSKWTQLIYSSGRMEPGKWDFLVKIWSRQFKIKAELQLTGKGENQ